MTISTASHVRRPSAPRSLASGRFDEDSVEIQPAVLKYHNLPCNCEQEPGAWKDDGSVASTVSTRFSDEDSLSLSHFSSSFDVENDVVPRTDPDIYGQRHPIETPAVLERKLEQFEVQVEKCLLLGKHDALQMAQRRCPELLTDAFKLQFLRCECFDAVKAAQRYCAYWEKRLELFGDERAFAPFTLQSMEGDMKPLQIGALQVIRRSKTAAPDSNADERDILYMDSSKLEPGAYTRESGCRAFWYLFHSLLEDEQVQKRGLIVLAYSANFKNRNRDSAFTRMCLASMQGCLPIRMSAFHVCHSPPIFHFVSKILLCLIGERLRKRVLPHAGKYEKVVELLVSKYDIPTSCIPTDMGGQHKLNQQAWLDERRAMGL